MMNTVLKYLPAHLMALTGIINFWGHEATAGAVLITGSMLLMELVSWRPAEPQHFSAAPKLVK